MKYAIILAALALSACGNAQRALDDATMICKDNVEYMSFYKVASNGSISISVVPHFKPDGSLYTCVRKVEKRD